MNLSVRDAAGLLKVSEKTIYRWIKQQAIPAYRVQDQYRFNRAEILEWATSHRLNVSSEIFQEPETDGQTIPSLLAALVAGGVYYRVSGSDKESALHELVQLLRLPEEVDREFLFRVLLAREAIAPTAVGDGIAIPHVRNPVVLHVGRPSLALCFLERPIEYGALDGKPVHTLFTIISPTTRAHLHLMSKLSFVLRDSGVRRAVRRQESRQEILNQIGRAEQRWSRATSVAATTAKSARRLRDRIEGGRTARGPSIRMDHSVSAVSNIGSRVGLEEGGKPAFGRTVLRPWRREPCN